MKRKDPEPCAALGTASSWDGGLIEDAIEDYGNGKYFCKAYVVEMYAEKNISYHVGTRKYFGLIILHCMRAVSIAVSVDALCSEL